MTTDKISVTVRTFPVAGEVSLEQVRAYLTRKGWKRTVAPRYDGDIEWWHNGSNVSFMGNRGIDITVAHIAGQEERHPAAVLRDIAGGEPTTTNYTRAQFAAAVDEAHAALHMVTETADKLARTDAQIVQKARGIQSLLSRAHEALHRVGAGVERIACATMDPEAQAMMADIIAMREREIPCGHKVADLISGTDPATGRRLVTKCGACLAERQAGNGAKR